MVNLNACVDCVFLVAYGDIPEYYPELPSLVEARWSGHDLCIGFAEVEGNASENNSGDIKSFFS